MTDSLSAPGGATYSSSLQSVGDGTWDSTKNDFLLPNIQGLNFQTTRYNGMGNRFSTVPEYHTLILGHGILAAVTFLGVVPVAILTAAFYSRNPHLGLRIHISLQIMTLILATVVFVLGYFAVGPSRSLTNPHHGIGVAIYVLIWVQVIGGALVHRIEKGKPFRGYIPVKLMLHQWLGRAIALLAIAQIPIGLALYGSPIYLFILYAILVFGYVVFYFFMTYWRQRRNAIMYDNASSIISGDRTQQGSFVSGQPQRSGIDGWAGAAAGGGGLAALRRRFSGRRRNEEEFRSDSRYGPGAPSQYTQENDSYLSEKSRRGDGWGNKFLYAVGGAGAFEATRRFFRRRDRRDEDSYYAQTSQQYRPPPQGRPPMTNSQLAIENLEEGRQQPMNDWDRVEQMERAQAAQAAQQAGQQPPYQQNYARPAYPPGMASEVSQAGPSYDRPGDQRHYDDERNEGNRSPGIFDKLLATTGIGGVLERRRSRKEDARRDAERRRRLDEHRQGMDNENEPLVRPGGNQTTVPNTMESPSRVNRFDGAMPASNYSHYNQPANLQPQDPAYSSRPPQRNNPASPVTHDFAYGLPIPPPPTHAQQAHVGSSQGSSRRTSTSQPPPRVAFAQGTAPGSPSPSRPLQRPGPPPMQPQQPPVQSQPPPQQPFSRLHSSSPLNPTAHPPISLHVRHSDDHVHVRRLNPEEADAERARRQPQPSNIAANLQDTAGPSSQSPYLYPSTAQAPLQTGPPQTPLHTSPASQVMSGGTGSAAGRTADHNYNRLQRKAERARNEQARQAVNTGANGRVNYT